MPRDRAASAALSAMEARLKKAFDIAGAFPVDLEQGIRPVVLLFDADSVGFHTFVGRRFAGAMQTGAGAGPSKVQLLATSELVVAQHTCSNLAAAVASAFTLRLFGPTDVAPFAVAGNFTTWLESVLKTAAEEAGPVLSGTDSALAGSGAVLWEGSIPAGDSKILELPVHLLPGARLMMVQETLAQIGSYAWHGYTL